MDTTVGTVLRLEVKVRLLMGQGQFEQAASYCTAILNGPKYDQRYGPAQVLLAQIYLLQGQDKEAYQLAKVAEDWLSQRNLVGWVQKCQEISAHCRYQPYG